MGLHLTLHLLFNGTVLTRLYIFVEARWPRG